MIERFCNETILWALWLVRRGLGVHALLSALLHASAFQPFLARIGRLRARAVFIKASRTCPAYTAWLEAEGHRADRPWRYADVPVMTKENYVHRYSIEQRCYHGRLPRRGAVIDESSGSTGMPNNWVRSAAERRDVRRVLQLSYKQVFPGPGRILLNCFALGPWATGMNISMSLSDVGVLKSIGPDAAKLENTLTLLGPGYDYIVFGYPPFLRSFVDGCGMDLSAYRMDFVVGGEGLSESLRTHLLRTARQVVSSYGASDLEINIGAETPASIALRRLLHDRPALCRELFGREAPPMLFQYNALDYVIEATRDGELLVTIARQSGAAPKIRYNIRDLGGAQSFAGLASRLAPHGIDLARLAPRTSRFPFLFVHGRNDASVPFYGAKIFPSDVEQVISESDALRAGVNSFQLAVSEDAQLRHVLHLRLERVRPGGWADAAAWRTELIEGLRRVNQDFREVFQMFDPGQIVLEVSDPGDGPFAGRDVRIKNRYVA